MLSIPTLINNYIFMCMHGLYCNPIKRITEGKTEKISLNTKKIIYYNSYIVHQTLLIDTRLKI